MSMNDSHRCSIDSYINYCDQVGNDVHSISPLCLKTNNSQCVSITTINQQINLSTHLSTDDSLTNAVVNRKRHNIIDSNCIPSEDGGMDEDVASKKCKVEPAVQNEVFVVTPQVSRSSSANDSCFTTPNAPIKRSISSSDLISLSSILSPSRNKKVCLNSVVHNIANELADTKESLQEIQKSFLHAVFVGNFKRAKSMLQKGAKINFIDEDGHTALHLAVIKSDHDALEFLLSHNASTEVPSAGALWTPLHFATFSNNFSVALRLLEAGADLNAQTKTLWTPLHMTAEYGGSKMLSMLLQQPGIAVNVRNEKQETPLHAVSSRAKLQMAVLLINSGASINAVNYCGQTPLHYALQDNADDVSKCLAMVRVLMSYNANIEATDLNLETPLHYAAFCGHVKVLNYLHKEQANIHAVNIDNQSVLHLAVESGVQAKVEYLIQCRLNVNARNVDMECPLHYAVWSGSLSLSELLISSGAHTNLTNIDGRTPLHMAAENGDFDVIELLLDVGADVDVTDNSQESALDIALSHGHISISTTLFDHMAM